MNSENRIRRARRWAFIAIAALVIGLVATRPNVASETQDQFYQHTIDCLYWFVTDMDRHDAECIGDYDSSNSSTGINGVGTGTFTPPPPPVDEEEPSEEPEECPEGEPEEIPVAFLAPAGSIDAGCPDASFIVDFAVGFFDGIINI